MSSPSLDMILPPLVRPDLTFDEAAIAARAEWEFLVWRGKRTREHCEREARRAADFLRMRIASGAIEREARERKDRAEADAAREAAMTDKARRERDAWIIRQCSTDGRLS